MPARRLGFSPKQGSHRLSVPYPPSAGLCICLLSSAGIVSRRHFAARKSGGSCDVAPERTAAAASGLVGLVGASFPVQGMPRDTTGVAGRRAQASFGGRKETRHAPRPVAGQAWTAWQGCDSTHQGRFTGGLGRLGLLKFLCASSSSVSPRRAGSWRASKTQGSKTGLLLGVTRF